MRALDGFTKPASGAKLAEPGGYLALSDADRGTPDAPGWEPIDRRQVDPGPFYLVWNRPHQNDIHHYPWPYQLATIEIAPFESEYPHTLPTSAPVGSPARAGFAIFRVQQVAHTVDAAAIVTYTTSGSTALRAARERPDVPILCLTSKIETARRLALVWGIHCVHTDDVKNTQEMADKACAIALQEGFAKAGDKIVVTAGVPFGTPGTTNLLRIAWVGT